MGAHLAYGCVQRAARRLRCLRQVAYCTAFMARIEATMERFVGLGCYIAYGGAATFKRNDDVREAFAATPLDGILFETDCPVYGAGPFVVLSASRQ